MNTARLTTSESLMLDIVRVSAAMVVVFGHLTQSYFSTGWRDCTYLAQCAVVVFFILSGFVIRYVTTSRPATLGHYMGDRLSRIYSVAVPALLFTLLADTLSRHVNPHFYTSFQNDYPHPIRRILINLCFSGQVWNLRTNPLSNTPYWCINYEVAYYIIYGLYYYVAGRLRWPLVILACLFFGYHILLLFPLWIAGCVLHDIYQEWDSFVHSALFRRLLFAIIPLAIFGSIASFMNLKALLHVTPAVAAFARQQPIQLGNYLFGFIWIVIFPLLLRSMRRFTLSAKSTRVKSIRFISEGTFPIYLFHFPMLVLIAATIPYNHAHVAPKILIFAIVVSIGILLGHPCNLLKTKLRSYLWSDPKPAKVTSSV